jgi:monoamine oxidase
VSVILENRSSLDAEKAIITVSLGILKRGGIRFSPELPGHKEALQHIGFGGVIKFLFEFKEPFWDNREPRSFKKLSFLFSDAPVPTWWTQRPDEYPLLTGWLGGPASLAAPKDTEALYEKAEHSLCYLLKCSPTFLRAQINHWHIANWNEDPNHFGAYSYPMVRTPKARKLLSTPVEETLCFAGEALYDGQSAGTVEAALASGMAVANAMGEYD